MKKNTCSFKIWFLILIFIVGGFVFTRDIKEIAPYKILNKEEIMKFEKHKSKLNIKSTIESIVEKKDYITLSGWAFIEGVNSGSSEMKIVLKANDKIYLIDTNTVKRPDVTNYFKSEINYDNSGFTTIIDKNLIKDSQYSIGIYIKNVTEQNKFEVLEYK